MAYPRRNRVQAELADAFEVSQSTISRAITAVTPPVVGLLGHRVPTADDLDGRDPGTWLGDKGYIGSGILTPIRKPRNREQPD
ncbi:hypothetical protein V5P93_001623 [Actinokineospora auranticolor]|uniref:hypothetical protein n=1 Tax=Actinokineospora auranticolor TaxID=155976 RepID=UPI001FEB1BC8|nr:hypothetical protein [Actinokineospora auranticolor]